MNKNGFSLIELLISLSIASVLTLSSLPFFSEIYRQQKANVEINRYFSLLKLARFTAVSQSKYISICALETHSVCGQNWTNGLLIFNDKNINGKIDLNEEIIQIYERSADESTITLNASLNAQFINYTPNGTSFRRNTSGNLVYCPNTGNTNHIKALIFSRSGRVYLAPDRNNNGVPENGSGRDISC